MLDDITEWDGNFIKVENEELFEVILAANYLDIKPLLDLGCKTVANMIRGKTPEQIREMFKYILLFLTPFYSIENDFTPEEEEQIRRENEWVCIEDTYVRKGCRRVNQVAITNTAFIVSLRHYLCVKLSKLLSKQLKME